MLTDTRILQRHDGYEVLAECQAIPFHNGEAIQLHVVRRFGVEDMYLRAWEYENGRWCVFDLRVVHRQFATELPLAMPRDRLGIVLYTLRANFPSGALFEACCFRNLAATWFAPEAQLLRDMPQDHAVAITFQPELRRHAA
jgi:hypothetical protein